MVKVGSVGLTSVGVEIDSLLGSDEGGASLAVDETFVFAVVFFKFKKGF